jgi:hypothetical protein
MKHGVCVCVFVWRKGPINEWVPARVTHSRGAVTSSSQTTSLPEENAQFQRNKSWKWTKIRLRVPMEPETKIHYTGECQEQLTDWLANSRVSLQFHC